MERMTWDEIYMDIMHSISQRSTCERGNVGAIIVKDGRIIGTGFNGSPIGCQHCIDIGCEIDGERCVRTVHSEVNAIINCALNGVSPEKAVMYTSTSPCYECAKIIINAKISKIVYVKEYRILKGLDFLAANGIDCVKIGGNE